MVLGLILQGSYSLSHAATTLGGTAWYDGSTTAITPNPAEQGYWIPVNQGNITGLVLTPQDYNQFGSNDSATYLQNLILPNPPNGAGGSAYATIIDLETNTVVGSSTNEVTTGNTSSTATATPFRFDSLELANGKSYAVVFTNQAGTAGTVVTGLPATTGQQLASGTVLAGADDTELRVQTMRWGGVVNPASDLMPDTGVYTPGVPSPAGQFTNYDQWFTATYTSDQQNMLALDAAGAATVTQAEPLTGDGFRKTGTGTYVLNQANTNTGDVIIEQGTLRLALPLNGLSTDLIGSGEVILNNYGSQNQPSGLFGGSVLELNYTSGNFATVSNRIEGVGVIQKTGAGQVLLSGSNEFIGILRITGGTIAIDNPNAVGGEVHVELSNATSLALAANMVGQTAKIASLSGSGNVRANFGGTSGFKTLEVAQDIDTTYSGVIEDNGARNINLIKSGTGTLKMTGDSVYKGTTVVNGGTLLVNGNQTNATGAVSVNAAGVLGGTGTVGGAVTINSGGMLAAGDSTLSSTVGTMALMAGLTFQTGSMAEFELSGATGNSAPDSFDPSWLNGDAGDHDHVDVTGVLTFAEDATLKVKLLGYSAGWGDVFNLFDWTAAGNAVANGFDPDADFDFSEAVLADGLIWATDRFLSEGIIYVVPEPSRVLCVLMGGFVCLLQRRRKSVCSV